MPNFALHVLLASRLAESWSLDRELAPFDLSDGRARNAFLHGAVGPDMGMYPGGERLLSDLVHRVRTGRVGRALVARARSDVERAFAWGWVTHLIADSAMHPLVNRAAARRIGRTEPLLDDPLQQAAHIGIELGLDAESLARHRFLHDVRLTPAFDEHPLGFVRAALDEVYGIRFPNDALVRAHRAVVRLHRPLLFLGRLVAHRWELDRSASLVLGAATPVLDVVRRVAVLGTGEDSPAAALLDPIRPAATLRAAVDEVIHRFPATVRRYQATELATLPDFDLETGEVEDPTRPTPAGAVHTPRTGRPRPRRPEPPGDGARRLTHRAGRIGRSRGAA